MSRTTDLKARYSLVDTTAADDGKISMAALQPFSDLTELIDEEHSIRKWMTLENNGCELDGTYELFPDDISSEFTGAWSDAISGPEGRFDEPPVLNISFSDPHTSGGITFIFSEATSDWCSDLKIEWFDSEGALITEKDFKPDKAMFFCADQVEDFYGLKITFYATNKPYHFLKLTGIRYGVVMELTGEQITACSILEEVDPISAELSINTMNLQFHTDNGEFDLLDLSGAYVLFQQRQKVDITGWINHNKINMGSFYLDKPTASDNVVTLECIDLVGTLDDTDYMGGYWPVGITALELITDIMVSAKIEMDKYNVAEELKSIEIRGYLPICTHREALQQVAFVIGAAVDCSRSDVISIYALQTESASVIPIARKVTGHTQEQSALVTGVEVFVHNYALSDSQTELFKENREIGEYTVQFSSPASGISISGAKILESGVNHAKINVIAAGEVILSGYTYEDTSSLAGSVYMEKLPANAKPNVKTVSDCTLDSDAQALAQRLFDYYGRRITDSGQILLETEKAGDWLAVENISGKVMTGAAEQMDIDLYGGFLAKAVVRGG